jgi:2-polyprenyl-3-methyl-5-hydroxy-6-metoxy-1,4-benzoquinol methylase
MKVIKKSTNISPVYHWQDLYRQRFNSFERIRKLKLWQVLCQDYLQRFIKRSNTVLDLGAGSCEFINSIRCHKKIAIDANQELLRRAKKEVRVIVGNITRIKTLLGKVKVDVVFMSNVLEHLDSKEQVFKLLVDIHQILNRDGRVLILQPDIYLAGDSYWDFFDHKVPLTSKSLVEALEAVGFKITHLHSPFLPYTTKTKYLPMYPWLLRLYLKLKPLHRFLGKQFFVAAKKL